MQDHAFSVILAMFGRLTLVNSLVDFLLRSVYESHIGTYFLEVSKNLNHRLWKKKMLSIGVVPSRGTGIHCMSTFPAGGAGGAVYSYVHTDRASATRRAGNRARANAGGVWPINTRIPSA